MCPISWLKSDAAIFLSFDEKLLLSQFPTHTSPYICRCLYSLLSCSVGSQYRFTVRARPSANESRLCSLEAANHAPWAVIREKVFNTGQAATGGLRRLADCNMAIRKLSPPLSTPADVGLSL